MAKRPKLTFGAFLFYAFTPLPSNYLFIAYGLTAPPLVRIALPFFLGRVVSYLPWARSAAAISSRLDLEDSEALGYFSLYFVTTQPLLLTVVYLFTRVDWPLLLREHQWRWLRKS